MSFPYINAYQQFFDSSGSPLVSGTIEFRDPTSNNLINSYPTAVYADAQTNANSNPLTLSSTGAATNGLFLEDGVAYKVILKDAAGNTVATHDDVRCPIALPYLQTAAESAAGVTPTNIEYPEGDLRRYADTSVLGNGTNDDTAAWVAMTAFSGRKFVPKPSSKYKIDRHDFAASDIYIFIEPGTIIETNSGYGSSDSMFHFNGQSDIVFDAYGVDFQFDAKPSTDEQRHIFRIQDCSDIWIYGATAKDSGGDGFYLGLRDVPAERIYIIDCVSDNNRRNGVSVTSARDVFFINHISKNTTGTSPQAGYDIEPNEDDVTSGQTEGPMENINFINCRSLDNVGNGFQYAGGSDLTQIGPFSVSFTNCVSRGDAINFQVGGGDPSGTQEGMVEFTGCHGFDSDGNGLAIKGSNMPVVWTGGAIFNPNQASNANNRNGSAVSIFSSNGTDGQDIGNVSIRGMKVRDPDGNMLKTVSMQLVNEAASTYSDIDIEIDAKGIAYDKLTFMGTVGPTEPISIKYTHKPEVAVTAGVSSSLSPPYVHQKITNEGAVAGVNFNINSTASQIVGAWYEFESKVEGENLTLTSDAGNEFMPDNVLTLRSTHVGEKIRVEWDGSNWQVTDRIGNWSITWDLDDTGTPTVAGGRLFITGGTTAITDFDDGSIGDVISILAAHSVTITHGSPINLNGSTNFTMVAGDTLTLAMFNDQVWVEVGRSVA
jgi:hypothetical protein